MTDPARVRRPSRLLLAAAAPLAGLAYLVLLPVVGTALLLGAGLRRLWPSASRALSAFAATVASPARPGEAHLTGHPEAPEGQAPPERAPDEAVEAVAREVEARRSGDDGA